jgi:two-component system, chemotaxis family, CheB/CheR fusion protein
LPSETLDPDFETLLENVKSARAFDFTGYKRASLRRRFEKRLQAVGVASFRDYADYLEANPDEFDALFDTILINVTGFFRDPQSWEFMANEVVPRVAETAETIRVWTPGCASGEEAYTIAMLFAESIGSEAFAERAKIYATDLDEHALREGRHAVYSEKSVGAIPEELLERYFTRNGQGFQFSPELRRAVVFGRHDLVRDPPISRVDLLICRNTLMYFNAETQRRILTNFHFAMRPDGFLFLGKSEVLMTRTNLFRPFDLRRRVFVKGPATAESAQAVRALQTAAATTNGPDLGVEHAAFETSPTAQMIVDRAGLLVHANAQARRLFGLASRDRGRPLVDLEIAARGIEIAARLDEAYRDRRPALVREVDVTRGDDHSAHDIQVVPLATTGGEPIGALVTFTDVTRYKTLESSLETARREVETAYEELQSTVEELETTNEELQSTNEELETTNEELHSTNEELETMNEELQSTNEELETMNDELARRTDDLNDTNLFLESILSSMSSAVVVVDAELRILAWNRGAVQLWGVTPDEANGEHLLNLDIGLPLESLRAPLRQVLRAEQPSVEVDVEARNRRGKAIVCHVTVTPLGSADGQPRGAILLMDERPADAD